MYRIFATAAVLVVVLAGCGGDAETAEDSVVTEATPAPASDPTDEAPVSTEAPVSLSGTVNNEGVAQLQGDTLDIELDDFYFEPTFVDAEPGTSVTLTLHNEGDAAHTFTIDELGIDVVLAADQEVEVEATVAELPQRFYCRFHEAQGMQGAFFTE